MRWTVSFILMLTIAGCTTPNTVNRIQEKDSVIKYVNPSADKLRFDNLYNEDKKYPETCTQDCYPASDYVQCETTAENCTYTKAQSAPALQSGFSIRWLGHASFHIQSPDNTSLLIDPVSQQFDWPVNWAFRLSAGFNRSEPIWPTKQEIKDVDGVLYSHIHYDHFNKSDIEDIGNSANYFTPLAFADHFPNDGYTINEMAWYSTSSINKTKIHAVPAHHFSSRIWVPYLYEDEDMTAWNGWMLEHQGKKVFFAGDTGYSKHFKDIHNKHGDIDICLMPIASYFHEKHGNWYRYVHTTPEDALVAASELNCKVMIPWGYGNASWKMGDHSSHSPLLRLLHMHKELQSKVPLYILNEGEEIKL